MNEMILIGGGAIQVTLQHAGYGSVAVPKPSRFARWFTAVTTRYPCCCGEITLRIVGRTEGAALNHRWKKKRRATNVLAFLYDDVSLFGDIVICAPVLFDEARSQGKSLEAHWAHMVIHGMLHLLGFRHDIENQAKRMEFHEALLLRRFGFSDPYQLIQHTHGR